MAEPSTSNLHLFQLDLQEMMRAAFEEEESALQLPPVQPSTNHHTVPSATLPPTPLLQHSANHPAPSTPLPLKRPPSPSPSLPSPKRRRLDTPQSRPESGPSAPPVPPASDRPPHPPKEGRIRPRHESYKPSEKVLAGNLTHREERKRERYATNVLPRKEHVVLQVDLDASSLPSRGEWVGKSYVGVELEMKDIPNVPATGDWPCTSAASALDSTGTRLMVFRAHGDDEVKANNDLLIDAVRELEDSTDEHYSEDQNANKRGVFPSRLMQIHRSQVNDPVHNAWVVKHEEQVLRFARRIKPIVAFVSRVFENRFPDHFKFYSQSMDNLMEHPNLRKPKPKPKKRNRKRPGRKKPDPEKLLHRLWGPFASCCVNTGGKVRTKFHVDSDNYFAGLCVILAYGDFDHRKSARLVIDLGKGKVLSFELPAGIPFFLPSAIVAHYNTSIEQDGKTIRGSIVFWTSGKIFQWLALDGRAWTALTLAEQKEFLLSRQQRWAEAVGRFPLFP